MIIKKLSGDQYLVLAEFRRQIVAETVTEEDVKRQDLEQLIYERVKRRRDI